MDQAVISCEMSDFDKETVHEKYRSLIAQLEARRT
jgi:hypothetical protein